MKIERSEISDFLPAPKITKLVITFTSIYPMNSDEGVILSNPKMGQMGSSDIELQTELCFDILNEYLGKFSDFNKLIKVEVCLASEEDFLNLKVYGKLDLVINFARTTLVVGDNFPMPGCKKSVLMQ